MNAVSEMLLEPLRWLRGHGQRADLARGAVAAFVIRVTGVGLAFGVQVLVARTLGLEAWGEYAFMLSWLLVLSLVSTLGLDSASLRFVATYHKIGDLPRLKGFLQGSQATAASTDDNHVKLAVNHLQISIEQIDGIEHAIQVLHASQEDCDELYGRQ